MSRLLLLRHARASWPQPGATDFDRPLTDGGRENAAGLAARMMKEGLVPDAVSCSPATRAVETWHNIAANCSTVPIAYPQPLYTGDVNAYLAVIRSAEDSENLLVIGHNPMLEDLALAFSVNHDPVSRKHLLTGFPTCGLAVFEIDGPLAAIDSGKARLSRFLTPHMA
jgi:phosphohistidine phosphatase